MLISPLMGPIIAATFGTVIKDHQLTKFGIVNELIGILITTVVGFVFGLIVFNVDDSFSRGEGLTMEMLSRTDTHSLIVGIFIAIPSGAAVAISILGENIGSLVGVAISASLLPPAVNSGLLWALAVMFMCHREDDTAYNTVVKSNTWSDHQAMELFVLGSISMAVTISNVVCVYAAGTVFLKIKEVAPIVSREQRQFWKYDVKVARDFNKSGSSSGGGDDGSGGGGGNSRSGSANRRSTSASASATNTNITQRWMDEFGDFAGTDVERLGGLNAELLRNVGRPTYQQTWSPRTLRHHQFGVHSNTFAVGEQQRSLDEQLYLNMATAARQTSSMQLQPPNPCALARHFTLSGPSTRMYKRSTGVGGAVSPPKYRSLLHDHIFNAASAGQQRRATSYSSPPLLPPPPPPTPVAAGNVPMRPPGTIGQRLLNIPEVSSAHGSTVALVGGGQSASTTPTHSDETHQTFERRAAAARATGRKFIVTPAKLDEAE